MDLKLVHSSKIQKLNQELSLSFQNPSRPSPPQPPPPFIPPSLAVAPTPPSLYNLLSLIWGRVVHEIMASSGPIWTAWPVLPVPRRASTSATPFVDLAGTHFPFFCCSPEAWGGTLLRLSPSFMKTSLVTSSRWRDLHWLWMFSWQRVWGLLPFQVFLGYPLGDLRVDLTQLFFMESPNRIAWHLMPWTI
jgi:hypothetical protein